MSIENAWAKANPGQTLPGAQEPGSLTYQRQWTQAWQKANPGQTLPGSQGKPSAMPTSKPTAPPGAAAAGVPASPPVPVAPPQFQGDSTYYAALAQSQFNARQQTSAIDQQHTYDQADTTESIRRLLSGRQQDLQGANENANRQGLLLSGTLGKRRGDVMAGYAQKQGDLQGAYDRREAARVAARAAIEQGLPLDQAALYAQAVDRKITGDTSLADVGGLAAPDAPASPAASAAPGAPPPKAKPSDQQPGHAANAPRLVGQHRQKITTTSRRRRITGSANGGVAAPRRRRKK